MKIGKLEIGEMPLFLAPMEDITTPPFRQICKENGADIVVTEFIAADGLIRDANKSVKKLFFLEMERPIGIQIFGKDVDVMKTAAEIASSANPDFIDINFGCPMRKIVNKGGGAALLKDMPLMKSITEAVVKATDIPITVKTRLGWDENSKNIEYVAEMLQDIGVKMLTIHGRTRSQLYSGNADWSLIKKVKENSRIKIPIIGNGDIIDEISAKNIIDQTNVDGIMIGRSAIGNPWIFTNIKNYLNKGKDNNYKIPIKERISVCYKHLLLSIEWKNEKTAILEMRRHYANYFKGLESFKSFRMKLLTAEVLSEIIDIFGEIEKNYT